MSLNRGGELVDAGRKLIALQLSLQQLGHGLDSLGLQSSQEFSQLFERIDLVHAEETTFHGQNNRLRPVSRLHLDTRPVQAELDRTRGCEQLLRYLLIRQPAADEGEHISFTLGQGGVLWVFRHSSRTEKMGRIRNGTLLGTPAFVKQTRGSSQGHRVRVVTNTTPEPNVAMDCARACPLPTTPRRRDT